MRASPIDSLIETLVESIQTDAAALRERHVLRQALYALVRQAQVEQAARTDSRSVGSRLPGIDGFWHKAPQQGSRYQ
jgi:hypothetical protein